MKIRALGIAATAARFIANATDKFLVIGPVVERAKFSRRPYFIVAGADEDGFWVEAVHVESESDQTALLLELAQTSEGFVMEVHADELQAAEACRGLWPCDRTIAIAAGIRAEREAATATRH